MSNIAKIYLGLFISIFVLWFIGNSLIPSPFDPETFIVTMMNFTGVITFTAMTAAMVLATRPKWLEQHINGLDKGYRLHKWLGITALVMGTLHWLWSGILPDLLGWGDDDDGEGDDEGGSELPDDLSGLDYFFESNNSLAHYIGEYGFYILAALLVGALLKKLISYRIFSKVHILMAVLYLALAFHALILMDRAYWLQPIGIVMGAFMLIGSVSALYILFKRAGKSRTYQGEIIGLTHLPDMRMTQVEVQLPNWQGHRAGQFAFVNFAKDNEKHHPFTISSAWDKTKNSITFSIKSLGDYTSTLANKLALNDKVTIEGPYGGFTFDDNDDSKNDTKNSSKRQIWIGGGVGITPFLARLQDLALNNKSEDKREIDFFYSAYKIDPDFRTTLNSLAEKAGVTLHIFPEPNTGRISGSVIRETVPEFQSASVWFCGGSEMGKQIKNDLLVNGLSKDKFEQELFEMR